MQSLAGRNPAELSFWVKEEKRIQLKDYAQKLKLLRGK